MATGGKIGLFANVIDEDDALIGSRRRIEAEVRQMTKKTTW